MFIHRHHKSSAKAKSGKKPELISHLSVFLLAGFMAALFFAVTANEGSSSSFKSKARGYSDLIVSEHTSSSSSSLKYGDQNSAGLSANNNSFDSQELTGRKKIEQLIAEEKLQSAAEECAVLRQEAQKANDLTLWTWALITEAQLRAAVGEIEKAIGLLMTEPWPASPLERDLLSFFYGKALINYYSENFWEIKQREEFEDRSQANDLRTWTRGRFLSEIWLVFLEVWKDRERLGSRLIVDFPDLWEPGDYPSGIRDTLRDAVAYELSDFCLNDIFWTQDQSDNAWRLNPKLLLSLAGKTRGQEALRILTSSTTHPIEKSVAILSEHETWCRTSGRLEASLEARFSLVRGIYYLFDDSGQTFIRRHLEEFLASTASLRLPWWAMGQAQLAEWVKEEASPDAYVRARKIALQGAERFPGSPGGIRCQRLVELIEQPEFEVEAMRTDAPGRRSLRISHRNVNQLHFRAFELSREEGIKGFGREWGFNSRDELFSQTANRLPVASWTVNLEKRADYKKHVTYGSLPDSLKPGFYFIVASAPEISATDRKEQIGLVISLSDLVIFDQQDNVSGTEKILVLSGKTGRPVSGATVELFTVPDDDSTGKFEFRRLDSQKTDASGQASFKLEKVSNCYYFHTAAKDGDFNLLCARYSGYKPALRDKDDERRSLVYTDRAIYRPGQKILWKVLCYRPDKTPGQLSPETRAKVSVWLEDENREKVAEALAVTNDFGTASGEFIIPTTGRPLGGWELKASPQGQAYIRVEEYKRPTFEVNIEDPDQALRLNHLAKIKLSARYYFGLPLSGGKVVWQVERSPWTLPEPRPYRSLLTRGLKIAGGTGQLKADGTLTIEFKPEVKESEEIRKTDISFAYTLSVDITDEGGETRSARRRFILGFVDIEAGIKAESGFYVAGEKASFSVSRTDLNGSPKTGQGAWRVVELVQPDKTLLPAEQALDSERDAYDLAFPPTAGDLQRPRWAEVSPEEIIKQWPEGKEAARGSAEHNTQGEARIEVSGLAAGAYKLIYETKDESGETFRAESIFLVSGGSYLDFKLPLVVEAEKPAVRVGETARFLVSSGLKDQPVWLEIWGGNRLKESRWLTAGQNKTIIEVPVTEELRGGLTVQVLAQTDYQIMMEKASVFVPWDNKQLKLSFATFRDKLKPGQKESWKVKVETPDGRSAESGAAELLAFMYDKSLELLAVHHPPSVLSLYPELTFSRPWRSNPPIAESWRHFETEHEFSHDYPSLKSERFKTLSSFKRRLGGLAGGAIAVEGGVVGGVVGGVDESGTRAYSVQKSVAAKVVPEKEGKEPVFSGEIQAVELRSDFSETAFWQPHLLTGSDGSVTIEFTVPDSVTAWRVLVEAVTRDLAAGSLEAEAQSVKELMVRPYLPRFLREGDVAALQVMVQNSSAGELSGQVTLEVTDPQTDENLLGAFGLAPGSDRKPFTVKPGQGSVVTFPLKTPARPGTVAFKVVATAGNLSDGELRPLPILPGRMHLAQSRFVALKDGKPRQVVFEDMASATDPTRLNEQLVITVDGQLFYSLLEALPYLINYPYECTEQTLNRFLATSILTSLYRQYPGVARLAKELSKRETAYEAFDRSDPNRKMALEETPWLEEARGGVRDKARAGAGSAVDAGTGPDPELARVLNPQVAEAERKANLKKLLDAQLASGAFPWWPGGPESPYMTLYIVNGLSRAIEFGVGVPKEPVSKAIEYLHQHYIERLSLEMKEDKKDGESPGLIVFLNYILTNFPDKSWTGDAFSQDERARMLDYSFKYWRECSLYLRGLLALTLKRAGRVGDATLVWESVMDRAHTTEEEGTSWMPEERSWLWYNDTIESQAFALRTLLELNPADSRAAGIVQWLFLNKKLNHWKSTRATAEILYSVASYLKKTGALAGRETVTAEMCGQKTTFVFDPDKYTGKKNQVVISGEKLGPPCATVKFEKQGKALALASATWHFSTEQLPARSDSDLFGVERSYFRRVQKGKETVLQPIAQGAVLAVGDEIEVRLTIKSKHPAEYVHLRDPRPTGCEPVRLTSGWRYELGLPRYEEIRDSGTNFFIEWLPQGEYTLTYRLRCATAGTFKTGPAVLQSMYAPEFTAYSSGQLITVK